MYFFFAVYACYITWDYTVPLHTTIYPLSIYPVNKVYIVCKLTNIVFNLINCFLLCTVNFVSCLLTNLLCGSTTGTTH